MIGLNSIYAQPNLALFIYQNFDATNSGHKIMALINFFGIWETTVIGFALQKWSGKKLILCMAMSFAIWILMLGIQYFLGMGG
jgi:hypothetical protein